MPIKNGKELSKVHCNSTMHCAQCTLWKQWPANHFINRFYTFLPGLPVKQYWQLWINWSNGSSVNYNITTKTLCVYHVSYCAYHFILGTLFSWRCRFWLVAGPYSKEEIISIQYSMAPHPTSKAYVPCERLLNDLDGSSEFELALGILRDMACNEIYIDTWPECQGCHGKL